MISVCLRQFAERKALAFTSDPQGKLRDVVIPLGTVFLLKVVNILLAKSITLNDSNC